MLSHLTFRQVRDIFNGVLEPNSGFINKLESGFVIDRCTFVNVESFDIDVVVANICEHIGKTISNVRQWVDDDNELDIDPFVKRIEVSIQYNDKPYDRIIFIIVYNNENDCNQQDINGYYIQKIALWY